MFFALGVSVNAKNKLGETPLFVNIVSSPNKYDRSITIREDITIPGFRRRFPCPKQRHGDPTTYCCKKKGCHGYSIIDASNRGDIVDRFKCLMELGCDPLSEDINQRTALDVAAAVGMRLY